MKKTKLLLALTPCDWKFINTFCSNIVKENHPYCIYNYNETYMKNIIDFSNYIIKNGLPFNKKLDFEHRDYLSESEWETIGSLIISYVEYTAKSDHGLKNLCTSRIVDKYNGPKLRKIFSYSCHEELFSRNRDKEFAEKIDNLECEDTFYSCVSVKMFLDAGLKEEDNIANAMQHEWFFHFELNPYVAIYDDFNVYNEKKYIVFPGKLKKTERVFMRFYSEKEANNILGIHADGNPKLILPCKV